MCSVVADCAIEADGCACGGGGGGECRSKKPVLGANVPLLLLLLRICVDLLVEDFKLLFVRMPMLMFSEAAPPIVFMLNVLQLRLLPIMPAMLLDEDSG